MTTARAIRNRNAHRWVRAAHRLHTASLTDSDLRADPEHIVIYPHAYRWCIQCGYWRAHYGGLCETCHDEIQDALAAMWGNTAHRHGNDEDRQHLEHTAHSETA